MTQKQRGIYVITNTTDHKAYVGSSADIQTRWKNHKSELQRGAHRNPYLQHAHNQHGAEAFIYRILELVEDAAERAIREWHWIEQLQTLDRAHGYNLRAETQTPTKSAETRAKQSAANKGLKRSDATKQRMSAAFKGRKHTPEAKQKISDARKGRPVSAETKQKLSDTNKGRKHTPEARQRMSDVQKGRPKSDETKQKLSDAAKRRAKGYTHTKETRQKLSDATKRHYAKIKAVLNRST